jgi:O-antigen/teichoic acid export membrane protein
LILSKKSFISAASSALSQLASFATSLVLTTAEGAFYYSQLGLAYATLVTFIFLLDLGFGIYFSREVSLGKSDWSKKWSLMLGLKLIFAIIFCPILVGSWWWIYGGQNIGAQYLSVAWPAIFISIFNISPILYGLGRAKEASLVLLVVPVIYLIITIIAVYSSGRDDLSVVLGVGYVIAWLCQPLFFSMTSPDIFRIKINLSLSVIPLVVDSFKVWRISLVGALYDRLGSFIVASISPTFVAYYLICDQALQAIITLFMQAQRAHFPDLATALEQKRSWGKIARYCINFQLLIIVLFNASSIIFHWQLSKIIVLNGFGGPIFLYLFSGLLLICSAPLFTILLLLRREGSIFKIIVLAHLIAATLWFLTLPLENLSLAINIRVLDAIIVWLGFLFYLKNYLKLKSMFLLILGFSPLLAVHFPLVSDMWLIAPSLAIFISTAIILKINFKTKGLN